MIKRYEVHPDPDRLRHRGITLQQLQNALANSNDNVGGDLMRYGQSVVNVRGIGLIGGGLDPMQQVLGRELNELEAVLNAEPGLGAERRERFRTAFKGTRVEPP